MGGTEGLGEVMGSSSIGGWTKRVRGLEGLVCNASERRSLRTPEGPDPARGHAQPLTFMQGQVVE